jgi:hypothetical protein
MRRFCLLLILVALVSQAATLAATLTRGTDLGGNLKVAERTIKEENKRLNYKLEVAYPQITGSREPRVTRFNQAVTALVMRDVNSFKKAARRVRADGNNSMELYIEMGYSERIATPELLSISFGAHHYLGGAHPNTNSDAINYDLKAGRVLRLADLFKPGSNYLSVISNYCIKDLKKQMGGDADDDWIKRGAGAKLSNYRSWNITPDGLNIAFDAYQVAPYVAGPQEVDIPYRVLKTLIAPKGPLGWALK